MTDPKHHALVVLGVTHCRQEEFTSLVGEPRVTSTSQLAFSKHSRPSPVQYVRLGSTSVTVYYTTALDLCLAMKIFSSRGFSVLPALHQDDIRGETDVPWRWMFLRVTLPAWMNDSALYEKLAPDLRPLCLFLPSNVSSEYITDVAIFENDPQIEDVASAVVSNLILEGWLTDPYTIETKASIHVVTPEMFMEAIRLREAHVSTIGQTGAAPPSSLLSPWLSSALAVEENFATLQNRTIAKSVHFPQSHCHHLTSLPSTGTGRMSTVEEIATESCSSAVTSSQHLSGGTNALRRRYSYMDHSLDSTASGPLSTRSKDTPWMSAGDLYRTASTHESSSITDGLVSVLPCTSSSLLPFETWDEVQWQAALSSAELLRNVRQNTSLRSRSSSQDKSATVARIVDLVREHPTREIPLTQLANLYLARHQIPLAPLFDCSNLKQFIFSCPELSLVWIYEPPPSTELQQIRRALNLDHHYHHHHHQHRSTIAGATAATSASIPQQTNGTSQCANKVVYLVERQPTVSAIAADVFVALVAHWLMLHEGIPGEDDGWARNRSTSGPHTSSIGMPLALIAQTWDANWSSICPLISVLRRSDAANLEVFVRAIPAFLVLDTATATPSPSVARAYYVECPLSVFLKRSARIPIIPELVPDPTVTIQNAETVTSPLPPPPPPLPSVSAGCQGEVTATLTSPPLTRPETTPASSSSLVLIFPRPSIPLQPSYTTTSAASSLRRRSTTAPDMSTNESTLSREEFRTMLFELITVHCAWQALRWAEGEDIVELYEEEQGDNAVNGKVGSHYSPSEAGEADDTVLRLKKKELRERKRKRRALLREWCQQRFSGQQHHRGDSANNCDNNIKGNHEQPLSVLCSRSPSLSLKPEDKDLTDDVDKYFQNAIRDMSIERRRQEYRNRSAGIFVSSIKMEWSKYFERCYPLTYFMEQFRLKKVKPLIAEIPNLVLTGDGGFTRVVTVEHAKLLCLPYPPRGYSADGAVLIDPLITASSSDERYQCSRYVPISSAIGDTLYQHDDDRGPKSEALRALREELGSINSKSVFIRKLNELNSAKHPVAAQLMTTTTTTRTMPSPPSCKLMSSSKAAGADCQATTRKSAKTMTVSSAKAAPLTHAAIVTAIWDVPPEQAVHLTQIMLVDLVRLYCVRQCENCQGLAAKQAGPKLRDPLEPANPALLSETQKAALAECATRGIDGIKLVDLGSKWNCSFVQFSPLASFVKKAGFEDIRDPKFLKLIEGLSHEIFYVTTTDGTDVLLPTTLTFLDDPQYHRPPEISSGAWMKRRSLVYLEMCRRTPDLR